MIGTGTFGCGTVIVEGEDFIAENVTFENSAPQVIPMDKLLKFCIFIVFFFGIVIIFYLHD